MDVRHAAAIDVHDKLIDRYQATARTVFERDHLPHAYDRTTTPNAHKLACVFLLMSLGAMFDLNRQPCECVPVIQWWLMEKSTPE